MTFEQSPAGDHTHSVSLRIVDGSTALVVLQRPGAQNSINPALACQLEEVVRQLEEDSSIKAVILTGAGVKSFCAGADLKEVAAGRLDACFTAGGGFAGFVNAQRTKPWIAAVNGFALAGGFEIALACDLVVASEAASFGLPEVKRGLIASAGGLYRLPRVLPRAIAMELITTGGSIDANRAFNLGLVNRVVPQAQLIPVARQLASQITANAPLAVRESIRVARLASGYDDPILRKEAERTQSRLQKTADFAEGSRAFVEKRPPRWTSN